MTIVIGAHSAIQIRGDRTSRRGKLAKNVNRTAGTSWLLRNGTRKHALTPIGSARHTAAKRNGGTIVYTAVVARAHAPNNAIRSFGRLNTMTTATASDAHWTASTASMRMPGSVFQ